MIDRRAFTLGLASLAVAGPAAALTANKKGRKLRDIPYTPLDQIPNHRQFMRDIVIELSAYAKQRNPQFYVIGRNAPELLVKEQREWDWQTARDADGAATGKYPPVGSIVRPYLKAIDGVLFDGVFCGRDAVDQPTAEADGKPLLEAAQVLKREGRTALSIEYCRDHKFSAAAAKKAAQAGILATIATDKRLGRIPLGRPVHENADHVTELAKVRNFLPMLNSEFYAGRSDWVTALSRTNYDLLVIDPFWRGSDALTAADIKALKLKALGSQRLVFASLPIGRASDERFYWNKSWQVGNPDWLVAADPDAPNLTIVRYWEADWKTVIGQYMQGLVDMGVDGVMLDDIDSYLYFEDLMPLR